MLRTNKDMKRLGDFSTRTPRKDDFTHYVYVFADGGRSSVSREDLSGEVDDLLYQELKKQTNNNEVQLEKHRVYSHPDLILKFQRAHGDLEDGVIKALESESLMEAIRTLLPNQQELIYRKYFLNKTNTLIGQEDGVSEGAIRDRLSKIHRKLQKELNKGLRI